MMSVLVTVLELVELWRQSIHAAAWCVSQRRPEQWAYHQQRGYHFLVTARDFDPLVVQLFEEPPHYGTVGKA